MFSFPFSLSHLVSDCAIEVIHFPYTHINEQTEPVARARVRVHATNIQYYEIWKSEVKRPTLFVSSQKLAHIPTIRIVAFHFFPCKLYFHRRCKNGAQLISQVFFPHLSHSFIPQMLLQSLKFLWRDKIALAPDFNGSNVFWFLRNDGEQKMKQKEKKQFIVSKVESVSLSLHLFLCVERIFIGYYRDGIRVFLFFGSSEYLADFVWQCFIYRFS